VRLGRVRGRYVRENFAQAGIDLVQIVPELDPAEDAGAVRLEAQSLRYRSHERLMRGFLGPGVFEGGVAVAPAPDRPAQLRLVR
jgi:hypothetical protein